MRYKDMWYYSQGNFRYKLYYSPFKYLIRKHILEQIYFRIQVMNKECYESGSCIKCGCKTTALQMCSKSCEGNCYPEMLSKKVWYKFAEKGYIINDWQVIAGLVRDDATNGFWQLKYKGKVKNEVTIKGERKC